MWESSQGADQIGDELEGIGRNIHDPIDTDSPTEEHREFIEKFKFHLPDELPKRLVFENNQLIYAAPDHFIFCYSIASAVTTLRVNFAHARNGGYDACFEIIDLDGFVHALGDGTIREHNRCRVRDVFSNYTYGGVDYETSVSNLSNSPVVFGDPFRKDTRFSEQFEGRLVVSPASSIPSFSAITVEMPDLDKFFERLF